MDIASKHFILLPYNRRLGVFPWELKTLGQGKAQTRYLLAFSLTTPAHHHVLSTQSLRILSRKQASLEKNIFTTQEQGILDSIGWRSTKSRYSTLKGESPGPKWSLADGCSKPQACLPEGVGRCISFLSNSHQGNATLGFSFPTSYPSIIPGASASKHILSLLLFFNTVAFVSVDL